MEDKKEYILIVAQEANFQSRSILIPKDAFLQNEKRRKEYEILKQCASDISLTYGTKNTKNIPGLLINNIVWESTAQGKEEKRVGRHEENPYGLIVSDIMFLANHLYDPDFICPEDTNWLCGSIANFCTGFNHVKNYLMILRDGVIITDFNKHQSLNIKPEEIVDSFLVLEANDGIVNLPAVNTVEEMYTKYYN